MNDRNLSEELKKMEAQYEPLAPAEIALVKWSVGIGVGSLVFLYFFAQWLFPGGH